jgi:hypothetical protein
MDGSPAALRTEASDEANSDLETPITPRTAQRKAVDNHHHGHVSEEAIQKAIKLGEHTIKEADALTQEYGKQCATILAYAGLSGKPTRSSSDWNHYQVWYASKYPKDENSKCGPRFLSCRHS